MATRWGLNVTRIRMARGLNKAELAKRAKVPPNTVTRVETTATPPGLKTLEKFARALDVDIAELFREPGQGGPRDLAAATDQQQQDLELAVRTALLAALEEVMGDVLRALGTNRQTRRGA